MPTETIHTCSYECERPECIRAQRDELAARLTAAMSQPAEAQAHGGGEVAGWVFEDTFVNAKFWTSDTPPQGWHPVYYTAPPSAPVGVKTLSEFMAEQEALHPGIHDKVQVAADELRAEVEEWKDVARCASEQQDSLFREARALNELADNLRAEVYFRDSVIATHAADTREYQKRISQAEARAERLAEALRGWWEAHRPVGWTEDQHRACPHVNLATDAEKALATALLRDQEEGK